MVRDDAVPKAANLSRWIPIALLLIAVPATWPQARSRKLQEYLNTELLGCRATLKTNVTWVRVRETIDQAQNMFWEPPVGTWVTERGLIHQAEAKITPNVREAKFALLAGDQVEIRSIDADREATRLTLVLTSRPKVRAKLELQFWHGLRKDLSDIDRFWTVLSIAMAPLADPDDPSRCGGPGFTAAPDPESGSDRKDPEP